MRHVLSLPLLLAALCLPGCAVFVPTPTPIPLVANRQVEVSDSLNTRGVSGMLAAAPLPHLTLMVAGMPATPPTPSCTPFITSSKAAPAGTAGWSPSASSCC